MFRGDVDLNKRGDGLRTEEGWSCMTGRRIEEEHCAKIICALKGAADQKNIMKGLRTQEERIGMKGMTLE